MAQPAPFPRLEVLPEGPHLQTSHTAIVIVAAVARGSGVAAARTILLRMLRMAGDTFLGERVVVAAATTRPLRSSGIALGKGSGGGRSGGSGSSSSSSVRRLNTRGLQQLDSTTSALAYIPCSPAALAGSHRRRTPVAAR